MLFCQQFNYSITVVALTVNYKNLMVEKRLNKLKSGKNEERREFLGGAFRTDIWFYDSLGGETVSLYCKFHCE